MICSKCSSEMRCLLTSWYCETCDQPENQKTCECGMWPIEEYGDRCPSCVSGGEWVQLWTSIQGHQNIMKFTTGALFPTKWGSFDIPISVRKSALWRSDWIRYDGTKATEVERYFIKGFNETDWYEGHGDPEF